MVDELYAGRSEGIMATVLYLDSSESERIRVASLLNAEEDRHTVCVSSISQVVERCQLHPVDVIVTELSLGDSPDPARSTEAQRIAEATRIITQLKEAAPGVPMIAVTDHSNASSAVRALQAGVVDYLPKVTIESTLVAAIARALVLSAAAQSDAIIQRWTVRQTTQYSVPCDRKRMPSLARHLVKCGIVGGILREAEAVKVTVALEEALVNAVVHGNLEVSSQLREVDGDAYEKMILLRERVRPYCHRVVDVRCELSTDAIHYTITDEGPGFDISKLPDPSSEEAILKPSGRGILLMRAFMDDVRHNATGNRVTLTKRGYAPRAVPTRAESFGQRNVLSTPSRFAELLHSS